MNDSIQNIQDTLTALKGAPQQTESLWDMMTKEWFGTVIVIIIIILFLIAIYIFFERYFTIKKESKADPHFIRNIEDLVKEGKLESAVEMCRRTNTPESRMIMKGIQRIGRPLKEISDSIENAGKLEIYRLEKNINILATIAGAAPMIGFLGTVIGLIMAFYTISQSTGAVDPQMLSGGMYTAMFTTAAGLMCGIPAYVFYNQLVAMINKTIHRLESSVTEFLDIINKPLVK